jgi:hypothetical protein
MVMLSCRVWSPKKFTRGGGRSSVCFDSVVIHDEFYVVLESSGGVVVHNTMSICVPQADQRHHQPIWLMVW